MRFHPYRTDLNSTPEKASPSGQLNRTIGHLTRTILSARIREATGCGEPAALVDGLHGVASISRTLADRMPDRDVREVDYHQVQ